MKRMTSMKRRMEKRLSRKVATVNDIDSKGNDTFTFNGYCDADDDGIPAPPEYYNNTCVDNMSEPHYEEMTVQVTVYALYGILICTDYNAFISNSRKVGLDLHKTKSSHSTSSTAGTLFSLPKSKASTKSGASPDRGSNSTSFETDIVPTTAVVSIQREVRNGFSLETFLPSMRLNSKVSDNATKLQCRAFWSEDNSRALLNEQDGYNQMEPSTFQLKRIMQREQYRPDTVVGQQSSFVHERIDLNVCVGRGKEMIPLGLASLVITGDEEGEVLAYIPVKPVVPKDIGGTYLLKHQKKKSYRMCFENEPYNTYSLEENATLRVGFRVIPTKIIEQSEKFHLIPKRMAAGLHTIMEDANPDDLYIEVNDENSLVKNLVMTTTFQHFTLSKDEEEDSVIEQKQDILHRKIHCKTAGTMMSPMGFFCGADEIRLCNLEASGPELFDINRSIALNTRIERRDFVPNSRTRKAKSSKRNRIKSTSARILSMANMSDMSESTEDSDDDDSE